MSKKVDSPAPEGCGNQPTPHSPQKKVQQAVHSWDNAGTPPEEITDEGRICRKLAFYLANKKYGKLNADEVSLLCDLEKAGWIAVIRKGDLG